MRVLYKQTPMGPRKRARNCHRCGRPITLGDEYLQNKLEIVCSRCVTEDDYVSRLKIFKGSTEVYRSRFFSWDIASIKKDIVTGREFPIVTMRVDDLQKYVKNQPLSMEKITKANPEIPGIIVEFPNGTVEIIDGHHRIAKAGKGIQEEVSFYKLSFKEQFEFMVFISENDLESYLNSFASYLRDDEELCG